MSDEPRYRYEATVRVIIAADGLDKAWATARRLREVVGAQRGVVSARASMVDLHHRPDLDGSLVLSGGDER